MLYSILQQSPKPAEELNHKIPAVVARAIERSRRVVRQIGFPILKQFLMRSHSATDSSSISPDGDSHYSHATPSEFTTLFGRTPELARPREPSISFSTERLDTLPVASSPATSPSCALPGGIPSSAKWYSMFNAVLSFRQEVTAAQT